jgi:hypothetical protein
MSALDTLTILIEADSRGLESQLKSGLTKVSSFIDTMNSQQVNWQSILAGSLDASIISGVAASFAEAISQAVQFQSAALNLNNTGGGAADNLSGSLGSLSGSMTDLAQNSGASLGDATSAFEAFTKAGLDSAAANTAVTDAAGIARDTGESLASVVTELVPLFQNWGVTTTTGVTDALTGMVNAAQNGQFSFDELASTISSQGGNLEGKTDIKDVAIDLATLSTQSGLSKSAITDAFTAIGNSATDQLSQMNILSGGIGKISADITSGRNGLITAFTNIKTTLDSFPQSVQTNIGNSMGLATATVGKFSTSSVKDFKDTMIAAQNLDNNLKDLTTDLALHETQVNKVQVAWNDVITELDKFIVPAGLNAISTIFTTIAGALSEINHLISAGSSGGIAGFFSSLGSDVVGALNSSGQFLQNAVTPSSGSGSIAERNNNPGDLRYAGQTGATQNSDGFAQFSSFTAGFKALENQLQLNISRSGSESLLQFAQTYAPSSDGNNPQKYASDLASQLGVSINTPISQLSQSIQAFAKAVATNEDGKNPNLSSVGSTNGITLNNTNNFAAGASSNGSTGTSLGTMLYQTFMGLI